MAKKLLYQVQKTGKTYWREILALLFLLVGIFFFRSERRELRSLKNRSEEPMLCGFGSE